ncbi:GAF and ANTAR domain-containing protein [Pseudarthrobacter sp. GA104]|uniref:GAF and ANTAR domain-containing protein n=1 Tax=Pseudarthrobacter sp. GA104 TaxID=2676311 RepID=UPI0012FBF7A8|nr:GAF and ANTAR domain-containing protein [Pseudarthrobacter sp. GA104]MUU71176.1 ANTAR domain-containing protein [Pseudarthrobacter sp. GA104]HET7784088.1 GAF and ANTAR domain-containing protein [Arthrobacter sp.]
MAHAEAANDEVFADVALHLQDLVLDSADVDEFLRDLAGYAAARLSSPDREVFCGVAVERHKKATAIAGSDPCIRTLDQLQDKYGYGPGITAMRTTDTVLVSDVSQEKRWPAYASALSRQGLFSAVSVPLVLGEDIRGALSLYCRRLQAFSSEDIATARAFSGQVSKSLRLALRIGRLQDTRDSMSAAMKSRTVIDLATGAIMAQSHCSQHQAFSVLLQASNTRNMKLKDVAATVVASIPGSSGISTYFDE